MTQNIKERVLQAALAGLLHDVGKVAQRASDDPTRPPEGHEDTKQPVHAAFSEYFIQYNVPKQYHKFALHSVFHHNPGANPAKDKSISTLVALADKLSSGERSDKPEKGIPMQMVSIFDRVAEGRKRKSSDYDYLLLRPLTMDKDTILKRENLSSIKQRDSYKSILKGLERVAKQDIGDMETYLENLLEGFRKYTWSVPSAYYYNLPDVSLYDHSRMTAALAACLADWETPKVDELLGAVERNFYEKPRDGDDQLLNQDTSLLIGGDISGVQDFIYTISSKNAAKTLRGRSFYLQLLTEAVLRFVLYELGLPYTNVIYSGGGHFFLLAPVSAKDKLQEIRIKITRTLLHHHGTSLYLALAYTPVPAKGFEVGSFPTFWNQMHQNLAVAKLQRYTELGEDFYQEIFTPNQFGGNPKYLCAVCGEDHRKVTRIKFDDEESGDICTLCDSFDKQIGSELPHATFLALGFGAPKDDKSENLSDILLSFGMSFQFVRNASDPINLPHAEYIVTWALDDPKNGNYPSTQGVPNIQALRYTVNLVPRMSFDELQKKVRGGFERLGVLRMDVDNMGNIFSKGFGSDSEDSPNRNLASLARLSTLSFQFSLFFEGWIKRICEDYPNLIYAVYAGGDDLFLITPWDIMPELAQKINNAFHEYTGHNPDIHLSGGMAFIGGKYPIYQAANDAGEAEDTAKKLKGKDAFAFLGKAWKWDDFKNIQKKQERIIELITTEKDGGLGGSQSIIQKLRQLAADEAKKADKKGRPVWGPWMWLGAYYFTRMAEKSKDPLKVELKRLRDDLDKNDYKEIAQWGVAARWAQIEIRKKTNKEK